MLTRSAARANHVDVEQFPSTPKRSNKSTSETPLIRDYVRSMNELKDEIREFREDVLIKSWVNSSRLDMLEGIVEKLANVMDKFVSLVDGPPHNVGNGQRHRNGSGLLVDADKVRRNLLPIFENM